jgi:hypothetical protein
MPLKIYSRRDGAFAKILEYKLLRTEWKLFQKKLPGEAGQLHV